MSVPKAITEATIGASDAYVQAPPDARIDIRDRGAKVDGSHDDRDAIQSAIDEAARDGTPNVVFLPGGTIRVSSQVHVNGRHSGVTICGTGTETHLRLDGGHTSNMSVFKVDSRRNGPLTDLTIRDIRIDCQKDKQTETHIRGITAIPGGGADDNNLVENVWFQDAVAANCLWSIPGTTLRFISAWGARRWHGIALQGDFEHADRPIVVEYCYLRENGTHGIDASGGNSIIRNVLSEENGWGGKNTSEVYSSRWQNVVFRNNDYLGYMQSGPDPAKGPIELDQVMSIGNGYTGFRFAHGCPKLTIGEIVAIDNDKTGKGQGNVYMGGPLKSVSATSIKTGSSANGHGFLAAERREGAPEGVVTEIVHDGNNAGPEYVNHSNDLVVKSTTQQSVTPISIPTNPGGRSSSSTESSYARSLEVDGSNVSELTEYSITVSDRIEHATDAGTLNDSDSVEGTTASGFVRGGIDAYAFDGEITDATFAGDVDDLVIRVDGSAVDAGALLPPQNTLEIDGANVSELTGYSITVSDRIEHAPDAGTLNDSDSVEGTTASGVVLGGLDAYCFDGEITDASFTGDAQNLTVRVNGSAISLDGFIPPANTLEITPGDTTEDQQDPIEFVVKTSGPIASDSAESLTFYENDTMAVGFSYWWPTKLAFDGDLVEAHVPASATVVLNGKQLSASEL